ncbi:MAG: TetR/AcrR family transcriptional regulator [Velocimicrobium sp.]
MAARELFVKKGYEQTSIRDILEIVDIAKGTFYYYFTSKEELHKVERIMGIKEGELK